MPEKVRETFIFTARREAFLGKSSSLGQEKARQLKPA